MHQWPFAKWYCTWCLWKSLVMLSYGHTFLDLCRLGHKSLNMIQICILWRLGMRHCITPSAADRYYNTICIDKANVHAQPTPTLVRTYVNSSIQQRTPARERITEPRGTRTELNWTRTYVSIAHAHRIPDKYASFGKCALYRLKCGS